MIKNRTEGRPPEEVHTSHEDFFPNEHTYTCVAICRRSNVYVIACVKTPWSASTDKYLRVVVRLIRFGVYERRRRRRERASRLSWAVAQTHHTRQQSSAL